MADDNGADYRSHRATENSMRQVHQFWCHRNGILNSKANKNVVGRYIMISVCALLFENFRSEVSAVYCDTSTLFMQIASDSPLHFLSFS